MSSPRLGNKTDAADCGALLQARRDPRIQDVRVKSVEQQALQALHRTRSQWQLERQLREVVRQSAACQLLLSIPGVGLLTATALVAAVGTDVTQFRNGRQLAAWMGLTPHEHSSGNTRRLGHITRAGDRYLRTLLTHGARSVLQAAARAQNAGRECVGLKAWSLAVRDRTNQNKATCALANKLARICFATLRHKQPFDPDRACSPVAAAR